MIDTFYVTDLVGHKVTNENRQGNIITRLKAVMAEQEDELQEAMPDGIVAPQPAAADGANVLPRKSKVGV